MSDANVASSASVCFLLYLPTTKKTLRMCHVVAAVSRSRGEGKVALRGSANQNRVMCTPTTILSPKYIADSKDIIHGQVKHIELNGHQLLMPRASRAGC